MTIPGTTAEQDTLNRRFRELLNRLQAAYPAERDEIILEMEGVERRLRELSAPNTDSERGGARANDSSDRRQV